MTQARRPRWYDQAPPQRPAGYSGRRLEAGAAIGAAIGVGWLVALGIWVVWWLAR